MKKNIIKTIVFITLFCFMFIKVDKWFKPVAETGVARIGDQDKNTVDALFIGSSMVYRGINPNLLWSEFGIAAFNYASPGQPIWTSYYYLLDALKKQDPKVVFIEIHSATGSYVNYAQIRERVLQASYQMTSNYYKYQMIEASKPQGDSTFDYMFPFMSNHTRWKSLNGDNVWNNYNRLSTTKYKGFSTKNYTRIKEIDAAMDVYPATEERGQLDHKNLYYMKKIISLAEEKDFELIFFKTPTAQGFNNLEMQKVYNTVQDLCDENNVLFMDYHSAGQELELDFSRDFLDQIHLSKYGSEKLTHLIGESLKEDFGLTDRRGNEKYESWEQDSRGYQRLADLADLKFITRFDDYAEVIQTINEAVVIVSSAKTGLGFYKDILSDQGTSMGVTQSFSSAKGKSYISILDLSQAYSYEKLSDEKISKLVTPDKLLVNVEVISGGMQTGDLSSIKINGIEYSKNKTGLNFVVYDYKEDMLIDSFTVRIDEEGRAIIER